MVGTRRGRPIDSPQPGEWKLVTVLCAAPVTRSAGGAQPDADTVPPALLASIPWPSPWCSGMKGRSSRCWAITCWPCLVRLWPRRIMPSAPCWRPWNSSAGCGRLALTAGPRGDALGLRVGLHTGPVAVGGIGTPQRGGGGGGGGRDAGARPAGAGGSRDDAEQAKRRLIWCRRPCRSRGGGPRAHRRGADPSRGLHGPWPTPAASLPHPARRVWAPFVGRHHELATLRALLTQVEEGRGKWWA